MRGANMKIMLLHVSVTSSDHQADISIHEHDMFSAYSMGFLQKTREKNI